MRHGAWLFGVATLLALPARAHANGRFPFAAQLVVDPLDATHVVVRTTFGPIQSIDSGRTWQWICERSVGYSGIFDPSLAIGEGGVLFGLSYALSRSEDRGCSFAHVGGDIDARYVVDLTVDPVDPSRVLAVTTATDPTAPDAAAYFFESRDGGRSFSRVGDALPAGFTPETVELASSRPARVYVSGKGATASTGIILRSDDGGLSWRVLSFDLRGAKAPYVAAVDPHDEARVFVRLDQEPGDRLVVSTDGGETFTDVLTGNGKLYGFALSPDATRIAVGGPNDGVLVADSHALAFTKNVDGPVRCLTWTSAGLWGCFDEAVPGGSAFSVGLSSDEGRTFAARYRLPELVPLACGAGTTTGDRCPEDWPAVESTLGIGDAGPDASDAAVDAGASDASTTTPDPVGSGGGGCGCDLPRYTRVDAGAWAVVGALAILVRRRRVVAKS